MRSVSLAVSGSLTHGVGDRSHGRGRAHARCCSSARMHAHADESCYLYENTAEKGLFTSKRKCGRSAWCSATAASSAAAGAGRPRRARPLEILGVARCVRPPRVPRLSTSPDSFHCSLV